MGTIRVYYVRSTAAAGNWELMSRLIREKGYSWMANSHTEWPRPWDREKCVIVTDWFSAISRPPPIEADYAIEAPKLKRFRATADGGGGGGCLSVTELATDRTEFRNWAHRSSSAERSRAGRLQKSAV